MIEYLVETGSTNADLLARLRAAECVGEGSWLVADRQMAGRGRRGRTWCDGAGNFMGSTVVRLAPGDPPAASLALVAGLALHETVASLLPSHSPTLKWPNDLLVGSAKIAGILIEAEDRAVVVGIGVNLAHAPDVPDRETVSLVSLGAEIGRNAFAEHLAATFTRDLERWRGFGLGPVISRWMTAGHAVGTTLRLEDGRAGAFAGLDDTGALQLRLPDGTTRTVHSGEVNLG